MNVNIAECSAIDINSTAFWIICSTPPVFEGPKRLTKAFADVRGPLAQLDPPSLLVLPAKQLGLTSSQSCRTG